MASQSTFQLFSRLPRSLRVCNHPLIVDLAPAATLQLSASPIARSFTDPLRPKPQYRQRRAFVIPRPKNPFPEQPTSRGNRDSPETTSETNEAPEKLRVESQPHYSLHFTCIPCGHRSAHKVSKQGYHHGSVLITCSECKNRHVISDHLGIFGDRKVTVEDLMRERGRTFKKGVISENGDFEFWDDDSIPENLQADETRGTKARSTAEQHS